MIPQSLLSQYRREVELASNDARNYLIAVSKAYIEVNPTASVADVRNYAIEAIQDGLYLYANEAKYLANDFFDTLAELEGSKATAEMFDSTDPEMIEKKVRYYARSMAEGDTSKFIKDVSDLTGYYVKREAFCNMAKNCDKNGLRYARVPSGRETCAFCFMLSSRGFVYWSERDAGANGYEYHPHCDCIIVPGFSKDSGVSPDTQIEGYKPSELYDRYKMCYDTINPDGTWSDVYEQWQKSGSEEKFAKFKQKALMKEINTRDWEWLWSGKIPEITFETDELKKEIEKKRPHEIVTAERLRVHGVATDFRVDHIDNYGGKKGYTKSFADFKNGFEIKTLSTADSYNTINTYLKRSSKKSECIAVVFDNSDNVFSDVQLKKFITKSQSFQRGRIYVLSNGGYYFIR